MCAWEIIPIHLSCWIPILRQSLIFMSASIYRCVYERVTFAPTLVTFAVSAWWHGFYPGYYFGFLYLGFATLAARKVCVVPIMSCTLSSSQILVDTVCDYVVVHEVVFETVHIW